MEKSYDMGRYLALYINDPDPANKEDYKETIEYLLSHCKSPIDFLPGEFIQGYIDAEKDIMRGVFAGNE